MTIVRVAAKLYPHMTICQSGDSTQRGSSAALDCAHALSSRADKWYMINDTTFPVVTANGILFYCSPVFHILCVAVRQKGSEGTAAVQLDPTGAA